MATLALSSPVETKTLAVAATVGILDVNAIIGKVSGVYVYCASECQYQIVEASAAADGAAAPASDFMVIPAGVMTPIPVSFANDYDDGQIAIWCPGGAATLSIAPYPLTR